MQTFLGKTQELHFTIHSKAEAYRFVEQTLVWCVYRNLRRKEKRIVRKYLLKMTRYSQAQLTRLIAMQRVNGHIRPKQKIRHVFTTTYSRTDIALLAKTDELHDFPNGYAVKKILERMHRYFGKSEYATISRISVSHLYNVRQTDQYKQITKRYEKTKSVVSPIGERRKPQPNNKPGYIRVDTVHQGDEDGAKGIYHINMVDEIVQFEFMAAVESISEAYLLPILDLLLDLFPFVIIEFHSDNGSEYINRMVVALLNKLLIKLTKSRSRKTTDNALVEGKNGSVIRKWIGYAFIAKGYAKQLNDFYLGWFHEYVNYHRPCAFATVITDSRGKQKKVYKQADYMTPFEKLKTIPNVLNYLKPGITIELLEAVAKRHTDNEMAELVQTERRKLFEQIT